MVWGWVRLVVGAGAPHLHRLLRGDAPGWARLAGMLVVGLCMVVQLAWLPAQPVWSILMVGLAVLVLRALTLTWSDQHTGMD